MASTERRQGCARLVFEPRQRCQTTPGGTERRRTQAGSDMSGAFSGPNETQDQPPRDLGRCPRKTKGGWQTEKARMSPYLAVRCIAWLGIFVSVARESSARRIKLDPWKFVFSPYGRLRRKGFRIIKRGDCNVNPPRACVIPDKQRRAATARKEAQSACMWHLA
jgi:hypothetical protein